MEKNRSRSIKKMKGYQGGRGRKDKKERLMKKKKELELMEEHQIMAYISCG